MVGAAKCGTSSLFHALNQLPEISCANVKEPMYFCRSVTYNGPHAGLIERMIVRNSEVYEGLFQFDNHSRFFCDGSTEYLTDEVAPERISQAFPKSKIIIVIRNPYDRIISEISHLLRDRFISGDVSVNEMMNEEGKRYKENWNPLFYHLRRSLYLGPIKTFQKLFGVDNVMIIKYEDLRMDFEERLKEIGEFLDLEIKSTVSVERVNSSKASHRIYFSKIYFLFKWLRNFIPNSIRKRLKARWQKAKEVNYSGRTYSIQEDFDSNYIERINNEIRNLSKHLNLDLNSWLK